MKRNITRYAALALAVFIATTTVLCSCMRDSNSDNSNVRNQGLDGDIEFTITVEEFTALMEEIKAIDSEGSEKDANNELELDSEDIFAFYYNLYMSDAIGAEKADMKINDDGSIKIFLPKSVLDTIKKDIISKLMIETYAEDYSDNNIVDIKTDDYTNFDVIVNSNFSYSNRTFLEKNLKAINLIAKLFLYYVDDVNITYETLN